MEFERIGYVLLSVSIFVYWIQYLGSITLNNLFEFLFSTNSKERWNCFFVIVFFYWLISSFSSGKYSYVTTIVRINKNG